MSKYSVISSQNALMLFPAVLCTIWHRQPIKFTFSFRFLILLNKALCFLMYTDELPTPRAVQLLQGLSYLLITKSIELKIPADAEDFLRHI